MTEDEPMDLFEAVEAGSVDGLRTAIAAGEDVDRRGPGGVTPLMRAAELGHSGLVRLLANAGADLSLADDRGDNALIHAARSGRRRPYRILSYRTSQSDPDSFERAQQMLPEPTGEQIDAAQRLEERLVNAIKNGTPDDVRAMLDEMPDYAVVSGQGDRGTLEEAIRAGRPEVVRILLENGADANLRTLFRGKLWSPLAQAAAVGDLGLIRLLIAWGADPAAQGPMLLGTPLMAAVEAGQSAAARALIAAGADVNARDNWGRSALSLAVERGDEAMIALLREAGTVEPDEKERRMAIAAKRGDLTEVRALLAAGADPAKELPRREPAFGEAVLGGRTDILATLLGAGRPGPEAMALAMYRAAALGHAEVIRLLLASGADPDSGDGYHTALSVAAEGGHKEVVRILLESGADPNRETDGPSALASALASGDESIVAMLREGGARKSFGGQTVDEFRGVTSFDVNEMWLLVRAPVEEAAGAFAATRGATTWERDVLGKPLTIAPRSFLAMRFRGHEWTAIRDWSCDDAFAWIKEDDARAASERTGGRAIYFGVSDTAGALTYALYERGELLERYSYGEEEYDGESDGPGSTFESKLRDPEAAGDFDVDAAIREQGAFVPSFGLALGFMLQPGMETSFSVGGLERDDFDRVDYLAVPPGKPPAGYTKPRNPFLPGQVDADDDLPF
jgi:ankyrin repeat protein